MNELTVHGPKILFEIGGFHITETIRNGWIAMAIIMLLVIFLTKNLSVKNPTKRQLVAEWLVNMVNGLVNEIMGQKWSSFTPYIAALFSYSAVSSLLGLTGLRAPTASLSTTLGFALVTFFMIHFTGIKSKGFLGWLKGFTEPVVVMTPLNVISEIASPISMSFRHFGNIATGIVISTLIYAALAGASHAIFGNIPILGEIPLLQIGIPAVLSIYFDVFTAVLQAYIISMLTMVFVSGAA